jgi:hypothetical protein
LDAAALANAEAEVLATVAPVNKDCSLPPFLKGSLFDDKQAIRSVVLRAESSLGHDVYVRKSEAKKVLYLCKGDDCSCLFRARFSLLKHQLQWELTVLDEHSCIPQTMLASKSEVLPPVLERALLQHPSI